ncbi:MAG: hypothetical protein R3282_09950, partial [Rhodothermales bacterium]|nr:hypothetical protein [Rhodothermales bacterium]
DGFSMEGFFVNAFGVGFDSAVAERARRSRKIRGTAGYLWVALGTLAHWRPRIMSISTDTWSRTGETLLATLGNGVCSGGGFYLTPRALLDDGMLDLCVVFGMSLPAVLFLLPRSMWGGHVASDSVAYVKTNRATISIDPPTPVHLDGEILTEAAVEIQVDVIPGAIDIRAPFGG